jgi:hypothetical protein
MAMERLNLMAYEMAKAQKPSRARVCRAPHPVKLQRCYNSVNFKSVSANKMELPDGFFGFVPPKSSWKVSTRVITSGIDDPNDLFSGAVVFKNEIQKGEVCK